MLASTPPSGHRQILVLLPIAVRSGFVRVVKNISVTLLDDDPGEADELYRQLRDELLGLDVIAVDLEVDREIPAGAKADPATITSIVVALAGSPVLAQLGAVLKDWVNRPMAGRSSCKMETGRWS